MLTLLTIIKQSNPFKILIHRLVWPFSKMANSLPLFVKIKFLNSAMHFLNGSRFEEVMIISQNLGKKVDRRRFIEAGKPISKF